MRTYDVSPLFRSSIGFDRLFDLLDQANKVETSPNWPPHNIEKIDEDRYKITLAVAGFSESEIELTQHDTSLIVAGKKAEADKERQYMHRGIASRYFRQTFNLAEHVKVTGAVMENGLLCVDLVREVPEALKPRRIEIGGQTTQDNKKRIEPSVSQEAA